MDCELVVDWWVKHELQYTLDYKNLTLSGVSNERRDPTAMATSIVRTW